MTKEIIYTIEQIDEKSQGNYALMVYNDSPGSEFFAFRLGDNIEYSKDLDELLENKTPERVYVGVNNNAVFRTMDLKELLNEGSADMDHLDSLLLKPEFLSNAAIAKKSTKEYKEISEVFNC